MDPAATRSVRALLAAPPAARDGAWVDAFLGTVPRAGFALASPEVLEGPDGFPYLALLASSAPAISVSDVAVRCTDGRLGAVVEPMRPEGPGWVFPYGMLWSLRAFGHFRGDPSDEEPEGTPGPVVLAENLEVLLGAPSEAYFPRWARRSVAAFLRDAGVAEPRAVLLHAPSLRPSRSLVFDFRPEDFDEPAVFERLMQTLGWFLPPRRGLLSAREAFPGAPFVRLDD